MGSCAVCQIITKQKCSNCNNSFYCSKEHQKQDWQNHKKYCYPFKVETNRELGRHLIATRNIKDFEIILNESPIVRGPSQITVPVCLGCLNELEEGKCVECDRCGWPLCSQECTESVEHKAECHFTENRGRKVKIDCTGDLHPLYQSVFPLRCLFLKTANMQDWEWLIDLESLQEERKGSQQWTSDLENIGQFIPRFFKTADYNENEIMRIVGIIQTNGHEVPTTNPPHVAIYKQASLLEHSCLPNLAKSFTSTGNILIWAPKAIKKNSNLSICYSDAVWCTRDRREHLLRTKLFECRCLRCLDITEFHTNYNGIKCPTENCNGIIYVPVNDEQNDKYLKCNVCLENVDIDVINELINRASHVKQIMPKTRSAFIDYLKKYEKWLAPQHAYLSEIKIQLIQLIGSESEKLVSESDDALNMKIQYANELIQLFEILTPCEVRLLGVLYFELHSALVEHARRSFSKSSSLRKNILQDSLAAVEKCIKFLQYEPSILMEGQIRKQAEINRDTLKLVLL